MAYTYPFRMASGTATMLPIDPVNRRVLLGIRADGVWVYPGADSLAGGFMEARFVDKPAKNFRERLHRLITKFLLPKPVCELYHEGENLEECAVRELKEELNIDVAVSQLNMYTVRSNSRTDTRAHVINACYWFELTPEQVAAIKPGDDLKGIRWVDIDDLYIELPYQALEAMYPMAFNHFEIMMDGLDHWSRSKLMDDLILAVWSVGNVDTPEDKAQWWKNHNETWERASNLMTAELASRITEVSDD